MVFTFQYKEDYNVYTVQIYLSCMCTGVIWYFEPLKYLPGVNISWGSKHHMTPVMHYFVICTNKNIFTFSTSSRTTIQFLKIHGENDGFQT